jgi:hypothetical protein
MSHFLGAKMHFKVSYFNCFYKELHFLSRKKNANIPTTWTSSSDPDELVVEQHQPLLSARNSESTDPEALEGEISISPQHISMKDKNGQSEPVDIDPITLAPLGSCVFSFSPCGRRVDGDAPTIRYNVESLVYHFVHCGRFIDPVTQQPLSDSDVDKLSNQASNCEPPLLPPGKTLRCLVKRKSALHEYQRDLRVIQTLYSFDFLVGELIAAILANLEASDDTGPFSIHLHDESLEVQLSLLLSQLVAPFHEMRLMSLEDAYISLQHWKSFLAGPFRRPTARNERYIATQAFLAELWTAEDELAIQNLRECKAWTPFRVEESG